MKSQLRILHLEDSENDCELIKRLLVADGLHCEVVRRENRDDFVQDLKTGNFDLIFADCTMPDFDGHLAMKLAKEHAPAIPFIFVSGTIGEDFAIESLRKGATDYVLKDRLSRLIPAVRRAMAETEEKARSHDMEQRLHQAQRLEAVGTLAGGVAHDFNNILTIIQGHAALLDLEAQRPERVKEISSTIIHATRRGTELVSQLLAFARKSESTFTATNINQHIRGIISMLKEALPRNIKFELQLDEDVPEINADPGQLERVLINLATNARDAMPNGGKLTISTSRMRDDELPLHTAHKIESYICLRVTDNGVGMDEATRQHIFEPFFTTKIKGKGTGLGMPVVYGLIKSHNGLIDVKSELGKGTSISLYLPISSKPAPLREKANTPSRATLAGHETILIVDDETEVSYFVEIILKSYGYEIQSAASAEEALEKLHAAKGGISLLFSDIGLPRMNGFGLSMEARKICPDVKIVLASGYADGTLKNKLAEAGINGFISKPYDMGTLLGSIRGALDKSQTQSGKIG